MRVLVTADRRWVDRETIFRALDDVHQTFGVTVLIEGCARGGDTIAGDHEHAFPRLGVLGGPGWARSRQVAGEHYPADWDRLDRAAGPIRNRQMLARGKPDLVVAFHADLTSSTGTADMIRAARDEGIDVHLYTGRSNEPVILPGRKDPDD